MGSDYLITSRKYKGYHYSVISKKELDYLHDRCLKIFKSVIEILNREGIPYVIVGGTLLGAVTTGHFIPWDDDLDMCIFDEYYDKALDVLSKQMPDWVIVQCSNTEPNYFHGWAKARDKYSCVSPKIECYENNGVWVDLYKIKSVKRRNNALEIVREHLDYLNRRYNSGDISSLELGQRIIDSHLSDRLNAAYDTSENTDDGEMIYQIQSASNVSLEKEWVYPLSVVNFEGMDAYTFREPEKYLRQHYGEKYYELPPDDMRRIGISKIEINGGGYKPNAFCFAHHAGSCSRRAA